MTTQTKFTDDDIAHLMTTADGYIMSNKERKKMHETLEQKIAVTKAEIEEILKDLDSYNAASSLIGVLSDTSMKKTLSVITSVINQALSVIFPQDPRTITIEHTLFQNKTPHFNVVLRTGHDGTVRSFKQSGTGLGQIVSFLFDLTLIDVRKGRPLVVIDELLNGLHPDAKSLIKELMISLADRYQFIMVEYGLDIGKQYEVVKTGDVAKVIHYESGEYYLDLHKKAVEAKMRELEELGIQVSEESASVVEGLDDLLYNNSKDKE